MNRGRKFIFIFLLFFTTTTLANSQNPYLVFRSLDQEWRTLDSNIQGNIPLGLINYKKMESILSQFELFNIKFTTEIIERVKNDLPITGIQLTLMHKSVKYFLVYSNKMIDLGNQLALKEFPLNERELRSYPMELQQRHLLWVAFHLRNLNHFLVTYNEFLKHKKLRILMNDADKSFGIKINQLKNYLTILLTKKSLKTYLKMTESLSYGTESGDFETLTSNLKSTQVVKLLSSNLGLKKIKKVRKELFKGFRKDKWSLMGRFLLHHTSGLFGNSAGAIKFRKGYLINNERLNEQIERELKPLDMITEKTPFILTDKFIPGHFGHNAIWLGTKKQLQSLGMWDHASLKPLQHLIEKGFSIIETDRSGTHLKRLDQFMNVDWFGVMRLKNPYRDQQYVNEVYKVAISQLGKSYDFNFDVETTDRLVCSELLYQSFGDIYWPTEKYLGRTTISPDNVASLIFYKNSPLSLVSYIKGNKEKEVIELDEIILGNDLGFRRNEELSTAENSYYEKAFKKCVNIEKANHKRKVCFNSYKQLVYKN